MVLFTNKVKKQMVRGTFYWVCPSREFKLVEVEQVLEKDCQRDTPPPTPVFFDYFFKNILKNNF